MRGHIALELAYGIREMKSQNIVHGDIKPRNILIDESCQIKIIDFGTSKILEQSKKQYQTIIPVFTPRYAPPELSIDS